MEIIYLFFIVLFVVFLGFEFIWKVFVILYMLLMLGLNVILGIIFVGVLVVVGGDYFWLIMVLGIVVVVLVSINVVGGYFVIDCMLSMFKKKDKK